MSKRSFSPAPLPPAKRVQVFGNSRRYSSQILSFDNSLYDELILCIFSHLSWVDLCVTQTTSRNWARLASDNEIWRIKYLAEYGRTRLRGTKGFFGRFDGREVKPLPGRAKSDHHKDWKWMFRISSNWRTGRCSVEECVGSSILAPPSRQSFLSSDRPNEQTHIILAGTLTITASSQYSNMPVVVITSQPNNHHILPYYKEPLHSQYGPASITALALDQSPPASGRLSLACFMSTGEFSVFEFNPTSPSLPISRKHSYQPSRRTTRTLNIIHAVYYHPLLVSLSDTFSLSIYDLSSEVVRHTQTLSSFTSYPPASLVLSSPSPMIFKLVMAYSIPVYPRHWSVGATELIICKDSESSGLTTSTIFSSPSFREDYKYPLASTMTVITSRTIRAFDIPSGWVDEASLRAMREQWGRKISNVSDAQTDGKWVVLAPGACVYYADGAPYSDVPPSPSPSSSSSSPPSGNLHSPTSLQLYRLVLPVQSNSIAASPPKLNFVRTLHGQTSPVSALALADGRCVSLGKNGSIWVWDLEAGTGAEVAPADETVTDNFLEPTKGTVSFDERRIVAARSGKVVVRRFDI
ncbi:hypothetical protein GALMADRAFT_226408 [Galerina marginata CBS 339.88]|uniref:F-box domain-containing protein n=1 Tax=Galerina marginata (strain CBS 339.88) TaxID=685588 RepID=A0A067T0A6_GALM3|nr:hypothetical protein GALMADRAFT_226408 [Galerina marginata CBS 339.88]